MLRIASLAGLGRIAASRRLGPSWLAEQSRSYSSKEPETGSDGPSSSKPESNESHASQASGPGASKEGDGQEPKGEPHGPQGEAGGREWLMECHGPARRFLAHDMFTNNFHVFMDIYIYQISHARSTAADHPFGKYQVLLSRPLWMQALMRIALPVQVQGEHDGSQSSLILYPVMKHVSRQHFVPTSPPCQLFAEFFGDSLFQQGAGDRF